MPNQTIASEDDAEKTAVHKAEESSSLPVGPPENLVEDEWEACKRYGEKIIKCAKEHSGVIEAVCAILLVLITGTYTYYTRSQVRHIFEIDRAWISFQAASPAIDDELHSFSLNDDMKTATATFTYRLMNGGHAAADVYISANIVDIPYVNKAWKRLTREEEIGLAQGQCDEADRELAKSPRGTVIPGSPATYGIAFESGDSDSTTQRAQPIHIVQPERGKEETRFLIQVGCIAYKAPDGRHHTLFKSYLNVNSPGVEHITGPWIINAN